MATSHPRETRMPGCIAEDTVLAQLERIERSSLFTSSPRLGQLLRHLVERSLAGDARALLEYAVGLEVFGRGPDFDPHGDSIVRVTARRLRQRLGEYYRTEGREDPVRFELPTGHYRVEFTELAPRDAPAPRRPLRLLAAGGLALALLLATVLAPGARWHSPPESPQMAGRFDARAQRQLALGEQLFSRRGPGDLQQALVAFQQALAIDPRLADAWVGVAGCLKLLGVEGFLAQEDSLARQRAALDAALEIEPAHPEANVRMAHIYTVSGDMAAADAHMARALQSGIDSALVQASTAALTRARGDLAGAIARQRRAIELQPLSALLRYNLGVMYYEDRQFDAALEVLERARELSPALGTDIDTTALRALALSGRVQRAGSLLARLPQGADRDQAQGLLFHARGRTDDAEYALRALAARPGAEASMRLAELYAYRGDRESALTRLEETYHRSIAGESSWARQRMLISELFHSPFFAKFRDDPRWLAWSREAQAAVLHRGPVLPDLAALEH